MLVRFFRHGQELLGEVGQRQAQRQATVLRSLIKHSSGLTIVPQAAAITGITQPPEQDAWTIRAPQRQPRRTQAVLESCGVKSTSRVSLHNHIGHHSQALRSAASNRLCAASWFLPVKRSNQSIQSTAQSSRALLWPLAATAL